MKTKPTKPKTPKGQNAEKPVPTRLDDRTALRQFLEPEMDFSSFGLWGLHWEDIYEDILRELTEEDLRTLWRFFTEQWDEILPKSQKKTGHKGRPIPVPEPDLTALFVNFKDYLDRHAETAQLDSKYKAMVGCYSGLAKAIRGREPNYLDRLITAWFQDFRPIRRSPWAEKYCKRIRSEPEFTVDVLKLRKLWPDDVFQFSNTSIPQLSESTIDPSQPLTGRGMEVCATTDHFDDKENQEFMKAARRFVRRWQLQSVSFSRSSDPLPAGKRWRYKTPDIPVPGGSITVIAAEPWYASDVDGYGTYIYVPPFYNWSTLKNDCHVDYKPLREMLSRSYEQFSPPARDFEDMAEECLQYVLGKIDSKQWTEEQVKGLVTEWCEATVKTEIADGKWTGEKFEKVEKPAPRYDSDTQKRRFTKYVIQELRRLHS